MRFRCRCHGDCIEVCDWFIKLSNYMIGSQLVENAWSFKPIIFERSVIFMISKEIIEINLDQQLKFLGNCFYFGTAEAFIFITIIYLISF